MEQLTLGTPALLFSTVSLLMIAFTNRFLAIASLIRELHEKFQEKPTHFYGAQIKSLRRRILLIRRMQMTSVLSLLVSMISMFLVFQGETRWASLFFVAGMVLQTLALVMSAYEIYISTEALQVELSDMEEFFEEEKGKHPELFSSKK
jgi:Protein of unknown function (DUF2721)